MTRSEKSKEWKINNEEIIKYQENKLIKLARKREGKRNKEKRPNFQNKMMSEKERKRRKKDKK